MKIRGKLPDPSDFDKMLYEETMKIDLPEPPDENEEEVLPPVEEFLDVSSVFPGADNKTTDEKREYTGKSVSYYQVRIDDPTTPGNPPYVAECNDIIEALGMSFAEGNAFKAIWRMCAARQGKSKRGYTDGLYDSEKVVFFGERMVKQEKKRHEDDG